MKKIFITINILFVTKFLFVTNIIYISDKIKKMSQ